MEFDSAKKKQIIDICKACTIGKQHYAVKNKSYTKEYIVYEVSIAGKLIYDRKIRIVVIPLGCR